MDMNISDKAEVIIEVDLVPDIVHPTVIDIVVLDNSTAPVPTTLDPFQKYTVGTSKSQYNQFRPSATHRYGWNSSSPLPSLFKNTSFASAQASRTLLSNPTSRFPLTQLDSSASCISDAGMIWIPFFVLLCIRAF